VMVPWALKNRWVLFALVTYGVLISGVVMETYMQTHYLAPITGFNYLFVLQAMRLWRWRNKKIGRLMLWLVPFLSVVVLFSFLYTPLMKKDESVAWQRQRARINEQVKKMEGQHLIIVTYGSRHSFLEEWVYNEADIAGAKIVYARAIDRQQDCQLVKYFKLRRISSLYIDDDKLTPELKPYPISVCP
jgi:4-amino-4-deoxy-L-arabinose transferase-like glycosyltransferase